MAYIDGMNIISDTNKVRAAILGTLVADASGMGLHWIYSQGKIASVVKANDGRAEYLDPDEENYRGVPSFFAHPHRRSGDASNYGEYIYIMLRGVSSTGFDAGAYIQAFQEYFGVGGEYVGYADGPMRETIFNLAKTGKEIHQRVIDCDSSLTDARKSSAAHYISRYFFEFDSAGLKEAIRAPLKLQEWSRDEIAEAERLVDESGLSTHAIGPDDDQMPALSKSAILAHFYKGAELDEVVDRAVRITNNNDTAVAYAKFMAHIMRDLYEAESGPDALTLLRGSIESHLPVLPGPAQKLVGEASASDRLDYRAAAKRFGAACHVDMAVPVVIYILLNTGSFREANRANILASGDNCGRAVMIGAIAGALYGVGGEAGIPTEWIRMSRMIEKTEGTEGGKLLLAE